MGRKITLPQTAKNATLGRGVGAWSEPHPLQSRRGWGDTPPHLTPAHPPSIEAWGRPQKQPRQPAPCGVEWGGISLHNNPPSGMHRHGRHRRSAKWLGNGRPRTGGHGRNQSESFWGHSGVRKPRWLGGWPGGQGPMRDPGHTGRSRSPAPSSAPPRSPLSGRRRRWQTAAQGGWGGGALRKLWLLSGGWSPSQ